CTRFDLAEFATSARDLGVNYVGVCCGGAPHHFRTMAEALGRTVPASRYSPDLSLHPILGDDVQEKEKKFANWKDSLRAQPGRAEWAADETLPVERLPNYEKLVHTEWLRRLLDGERPEAAPAGQFLLFHVNFGVPEEYEDGHIPGALYLDTNRLESPDDWNRRSPAELEHALCALG